MVVKPACDQGCLLASVPWEFIQSDTVTSIMQIIDQSTLRTVLVAKLLTSV